MGLAVGVAALILTISILNGFEKELKVKLVGFDAHIRLRLFYNETMDSTLAIEEKLNNIPEIKHLVPYIHSQAIIKYKQEVDGIIVEGISEKDIRKSLKIDKILVKGDLRFDLDDGSDGIVIGQKLASFLGTDLGDIVYIFALHGMPSIGKKPRIGRFKITGIYDSGMADYDDIFVYTNLSAAQDIFNLGDSFSGYQIILNDPNKADEIANQISDSLGYPYHAMSWTELHSTLFEWLNVQRIPILFIFGLIAIVAIFNIVSTLMMIVIEKTRDIGALKSMGVDRKQTVSIFLLEGTIIGITGTLLGFIIVGALTWLQLKFAIISIPEDVYFMSKLPVLLYWRDFLIIGLGALFFSIVATIYPSLKSVKLSAAEATRYE